MSENQEVLKKILGGSRKKKFYYAKISYEKLFILHVF